MDLERACYPPTRAYGASEYRRALRSSAAANLLAGEAEDAVGFGGILFDVRARVANVYTLHVRPEGRRRGLARALLAALESRAKAAGMRVAVLEVGVENAAAVGLYRSAGYVEVERLADYYADGEDAWRMAKRLT